MSMIRVGVKKPGYKVEYREIDEDDLEGFQKIVGGYIETFFMPLSLGNLICICNEEGKLDNLPYNFSVPNDDILGTVCFVRYDGGENWHGLSDEQVEYLNKAFGTLKQASQNADIE